MTVGMTSAAFYGHGETEDQAAMLRNYPLDVCELFLQTNSEYSAAFGALARAKLAGLPCVSVHPKGTQFELDLFGRSARQTADALAVFRRVCETGQVLGASYYVFHGPFSVSGPLNIRNIHELPERLALLRRVAAEYSLELLWENVSWCALRGPEDVAALSAVTPDIGFVLDIKQARRAGVDPFDLVHSMGGRIRHVHALDCDARGRLCLPGQGVTDWRALLCALRAEGFDGAVILEPYEFLARDPEALRRSLDFLRAACL